MLKRFLSLLTAAATVTAYTQVIPAHADDAPSVYPYTIFAGSDAEGALTINSGNVCINGNVATNGTIAASSANFNVNGQRTEHAGAEMILINSRLSQTFFETTSTTLVNGDYSVEDVNIYINDPLDVTGDIDLTGNIDLNAGIRSLEDITISGNVKNARNTVICSQTGDISIDTTNVNFTGLIYAPYGDITIDSDNLNLNSVIIIGQTVTITCPNLNMNYSPVMGQIVESVSTDNDDTDPVADGRIIAMGDYNPEANAIDISWYTESTPTFFEILVSDDNTEYTSAAVVTEGTEYSYPIGEGFDTRYFKISYTDGEGSVTESIPFYVERTEDGYEVKLLDSDGDELPDLYESIMDTDPLLADTDNDGLTDYQEICLTGTDPVKADSVTEGVSDADADIDGDGISNAEEISLGTDPMSADSDNDGLSDYDEINTHHTDPLNNDTDGDSIMDGSEWKIGLDPTNGSTHGVPDGEYSIEQTVASDSSVFALINTADSPYDLSVKINTTGCAEDEMTVTESGYAHAIENEMITGQSVDISMPEGRTAETMRISFSIRDDQVGNKLNKYTDCEELCGIKRFNVFHFYESVNMLLPMETSFDTENNVVYTDTTESGTFCLVDMEYWMDCLGIEPAGAGEPSNGFMTIQGASIGADDTGIQKQRFDGRDYALIESGMITWSEAKAACENMGGHLCTITNESEQHFIEQLIDSGTKDSYWLGGTDEADEGNWSWITGEPWEYENWGNGQPSDQNYHPWIVTAGTWIEDYLGITRLYHSWGTTNEWNDYKTDDPVIGGYICEWENEDIEGTKYDAFIATRWKTITLDTPLSPDSDTDTDTDTLTDWDEVKNEYLTLKEDGSYELPLFTDVFTSADITVNVNLYYGTPYAIPYEDVWRRRVLPVNTDPSVMDTDKDGLDDDFEFILSTDPLSYDTDADGLADGFEVDEYYDPLDPNPDGDSFNDYDEFQNGTSPYVYDKTGKERAAAILRGAVYGDFEVPDDLETLLGQLAGSFIPFVADGRDYIANVFVNGNTAGALMNLGGCLMDAIPFAGGAGDAVKAVPKVAKFIIKHTDDVPLIVGAITLLTKRLPDAEKVIAKLVKKLPASSFDELALAVEGGGKLTKSEYKSLKVVFEASGRNIDDAVEMSLKVGTKIHERIIDIAQKFNKSYINKVELNCTKCANEIEKVLKRNNLHGKRIVMEAVTEDGTKAMSNIALISEERFVSTNGRHVAIQYDGKVYDNIFPNGIDYDDWIKQFDFLYHNVHPDFSGSYNF